MRASPIAIALALATAACTVPGPRVGRQELPVGAAAPSESKAPPPAAVADYTYQLLTPQQTGLAQVFDDGHRTFLSFTAATPPGLMIFDENGRPVAFKAAGDTAVIDAVRRGWLIRTPTLSSYAQARTPERVARIEASGAEGEGLIALPEDLAAARAEILSVQRRLVGLSAELDRASRGDPAAPLVELKSEIEEIQTRLDGVNATLVRAFFSTGSASLALSEATQRALVDAAQEAQSVRIRGGADSTGSAEVNARVAMARALSLQRLLIEGGIEPGKLTTSVASEDYVASNATPAGRALNRRVDVFFVGKTDEVIHGTSQSPAIPPQSSSTNTVASVGTPLSP